MPPLRSVATLLQVARSAVSSVSGSTPSRTRLTRWRSRWTSRSQPPWPGTHRRTRARPAGMSKALRSKRSSRAPTASGGALIRGALAGGERPSDALRDACRLLVALDLECEASHDLPPVPADLVHRNHFCLCAQPGARGDGGREAHLVPAVIHAEHEALGLDQAEPEAVDHRERQVPVGDRRAERALGLRSPDVHADPLVVARALGERVGQLLRDLTPLARAHFLPDERLQLLDPVRGDQCHRDSPYRWRRRWRDIAHPAPLQQLHLLTLRK